MLLAQERALGVPDGKPPVRVSPLIAIDQGEELFATEDAGESKRFLGLLGRVLSSPPEGLDPYALVTIRADSVLALLNIVPELRIDTPHTIMLPPLSPAAYRDVITKPAGVYTRQVKRLDIEPELIQVLITDATGADALPLLAFTLQRLFNDFSPEQKLALAHYKAIGGIGGSIDRALAAAQREAGAAGTSDMLRRLIVPGLATWDPAANAAKRLVAQEADLISGDRAPLAPLANSLVEARLLTRGAGTLEVAHEALLRRPPIAGWLEEQKDALKLRDDVLREAREWEGGGLRDKDLVRRGERLSVALDLLASPDFSSALAPTKTYFRACQRQERAVTRQARRARAAIYTLMLGVIAALLTVIFKEPIGDFWFEQTTVHKAVATQFQPYLKTAEEERALKPGDTFRECAKDSKSCPDMVVLPAGTFQMGSPASGKGPLYRAEGPQHTVTIAKPFAVARYDVTWNEWEACVALKGCDGAPTGDPGFGMGDRPVINVTWYEAKAYVAWLSKMTGKNYRLLTEAEWEYAARGVTQADAPHPAYPWGDDTAGICQHANLADQSFQRAGYGGDIADCDDKYATTAPVGSFPPNAFGLHDMHGNVWQWVEDAWHMDYGGEPPADGSEWREGADPVRRVVRGGSWYHPPQVLRSASRLWYSTGSRDDSLGFRVGRTLSARAGATRVSPGEH
jgi:formylglycine-generating enzyme required for sulfatase activity